MAMSKAFKLDVFDREKVVKKVFLWSFPTKNYKLPTLLEMCNPTDGMDTIENHPFNEYTFTGKWLLTNCKCLHLDFPEFNSSDEKEAIDEYKELKDNLFEEAKFEKYYEHLQKNEDYRDKVKTVLETFYIMFYYHYRFSPIRITRILQYIERGTIEQLTNELKNDEQDRRSLRTIIADRKYKDGEEFRYLYYLDRDMPYKKNQYYCGNFGDNQESNQESKIGTIRMIYHIAASTGKTVFFAVRYAIWDLIAYTSSCTKRFTGACYLSKNVLRNYNKIITEQRGNFTNFQRSSIIDLLYDRDVMFAILKHLHPNALGSKTKKLSNEERIATLKKRIRLQKQAYTYKNIDVDKNNKLLYKEHVFYEQGLTLTNRDAHRFSEQFEQFRYILAFLENKKRSDVPTSITTGYEDLWDIPRPNVLAEKWNYLDAPRSSMIPPTVVLALAPVNPGELLEGVLPDFDFDFDFEIELGGGKRRQKLSELSVKELKKTAKDKNLKGYSKLNKAELIALLHKNKSRQILK